MRCSSAWYFIFSTSRALFAISLEQIDRRSRYSASEVLGLLNSENLNDFGLLESEDSDCDHKDVESYLPEV